MTRPCILGVASLCATLWLATVGARPAHAAPELDIVGSENQSLTFTSNQPAFAFTFTVVAQNAEPVGDVRVFGGDFRDAAGAAQPTAWQIAARGPFTGELTIPVHATLTEPGEYKAVLVLHYGGQRHPFIIKVVRPTASSRLDLPLVTLGATVTDIELPPDSLVTALVIRNDGPEPLTLRPRGVSVALARAADLVSTKATATAVLDKAEPPPTATTATTATATLDKLDVRSGERARIKITVHDLTEPGKYQGRIQLTAEQSGYKPLDVEFTLLVKRSAGYAATLIAAGVLASFLFNWIFNKRRARLVARRDLARVRERCDALDRGDLRERERGMIAAVRRGLDELALDAQFGIDAGRRDTLTRLARKLDILELAIEIARFVDLLDPAKAAATRQALDVAAAKLKDPVITLEALGTAYDELRELKTRTDTRLAVKLGIAAIGELVRAQRALTTEPGELATKLSGVQRHLDEATRLHAEDELKQASQEYKLARDALVPVLAAALEARLQRRIEPFEADAWAKLVAELGPLLEAVRASAAPEDQLAAYRTAQTRFYRGAFEAVAARATKLASARPAHQAEFTSFAARISGEAASLELVRADDAGPRFTAAMAELDRLDDATTLDAKPFTVAAPLGGPALPRSIPGELRLPPPDVPSARRLQRTVDRADLIALGALLVISVLSGVQLLWAGDATWGNFDSKLLAFLWGLGLHSVGNQPFKNAFHLSSLLAEQPAG